MRGGGKKGGGCSHRRFPAPGEGRHGAALAPQAWLLGERGAEAGGVSKHKTAHHLDGECGGTGDKVCPRPPPGELNIKRSRFGKGWGWIDRWDTMRSPQVLLGDRQHPLPP